MEPVPADAALLRAVLTTELDSDLTLTLGRELVARVVSAQTGAERGLLSLAGTLVEAELPADVQTGEELHLVVRELTPNQVVLGLQAQAGAVPLSPPAAEPPRVPVPRGGTLQVRERDAASRARDAADVHHLALRYDTPHLGTLDLAFTLTPAGLQLAITVPPGRPYQRVRATTNQLGNALAQAAGRPASVTIEARHEPLEVFA